MGSTFVRSPACSDYPNSKVGSAERGQSPGARSPPGARTADSVPPQPAHVRVSRNAAEPAELRTTGPED
jgi:hypothetical protein